MFRVVPFCFLLTLAFPLFAQDSPELVLLMRKHKNARKAKVILAGDKIRLVTSYSHITDNIQRIEKDRIVMRGIAIPLHEIEKIKRKSFRQTLGLIMIPIGFLWMRSELSVQDGNNIGSASVGLAGMVVGIFLTQSGKYKRSRWSFETVPLSQWGQFKNCIHYLEFNIVTKSPPPGNQRDNLKKF